MTYMSAAGDKYDKIPDELLDEDDEKEASDSEEK